MKRLLIAIPFFPVFYAIVRFRNPLIFTLFVVLVAATGLFEFYRLFFRERKWSVIWTGEAISLGLLSAFYLQGMDLEGLEKFSNPFFLVSFFTVLFLLFLAVHLLTDRDAFFLSVSVMGTGLIYVPWLLGHLILLRLHGRGAELIFLLAMVTWGTDAGALYTGKLAGRRKLAATISPNKTVEGAVGGLIFGVTLGWVARALLFPAVSLSEIGVLSLVMSASGQAGDLVESMFKRANQVKDSGGLLPGHGGILDKIDSFVFTGPVLFYYVTYVSPSFGN
jgi:phosphatidate cytidylyltransferase